MTKLLTGQNCIWFLAILPNWIFSLGKKWQPEISTECVFWFMSWFSRAALSQFKDFKIVQRELASTHSEICSPLSWIKFRTTVAGLLRCGWLTQEICKSYRSLTMLFTHLTHYKSIVMVTTCKYFPHCVFMPMWFVTFLFSCCVVVVIGQNQPDQSSQTESHLQATPRYSEEVCFLIETKVHLSPVCVCVHVYV